MKIRIVRQFSKIVFWVGFAWCKVKILISVTMPLINNQETIIQTRPQSPKSFLLSWMNECLWWISVLWLMISEYWNIRCTGCVCIWGPQPGKQFPTIKQIAFFHCFQISRIISLHFKLFRNFLGFHSEWSSFREQLLLLLVCCIVFINYIVHFNIELCSQRVVCSGSMVLI